MVRCDYSQAAGISITFKNLCQELVDSVLCPGQVAKTKARYRMFYGLRDSSVNKAKGKKSKPVKPQTRKSSRVGPQGLTSPAPKV